MSNEIKNRISGEWAQADYERLINGKLQELLDISSKRDMEAKSKDSSIRTILNLAVQPGRKIRDARIFTKTNHVFGVMSGENKRRLVTVPAGALFIRYDQSDFSGLDNVLKIAIWQENGQLKFVRG